MGGYSFAGILYDPERCRAVGLAGTMGLELNQYACIDAAAGEIVGDTVAMVFGIGNPIVGVYVVDAQQIEGIYS